MRLHLLANLGEAAHAIARPAGRVIHAEPGDAGDGFAAELTLAPNAVWAAIEQEVVRGQ